MFARKLFETPQFVVRFRLGKLETGVRLAILRFSIISRLFILVAAGLQNRRRVSDSICQTYIIIRRYRVNAERRLFDKLHNLTGGESRGPGPLKVVATQLARHIYNFAEKESPGTRLASIVCDERSAVETPPTVTSAFLKPSVPAGVSWSL